MWVVRIELRSSGLQDKHFTNEAISLSPETHVDLMKSSIDSGFTEPDHTVTGQGAAVV